MQLQMWAHLSPDVEKSAGRENVFADHSLFSIFTLVVHQRRHEGLGLVIRDFDSIIRNLLCGAEVY